MSSHAVLPWQLEMRKVGQCALKVTACIIVECIHTVVSVECVCVCLCEDARETDAQKREWE